MIDLSTKTDALPAGSEEISGLPRATLDVSLPNPAKLQIDLDMGALHWDLMTHGLAKREICVGVRVMDARPDRGYYRRSEDGYPKTYHGFYNSRQEFLNDLLRFQWVSVYWHVNPLSTDLLALASNRIVHAKDSATAKDVTCLRQVLIDVDSHRRKGVSATDAELGHAVELRDRILEGEPAIRESSYWGRSGSGGWIMLRLPRPLPNNAESQAKVKSILTGLAAKYQSEHASVDTCTNDAARLCCVGGSVKAKGDNTLVRPWRNVTVEGQGGGFA